MERLEKDLESDQELSLARAFLMGSESLWCSAHSLHFRSSPPDGGPSRRAGLWLALRRRSVGGAGPGPRPPLSQCSAGAGPPPRKPGALLPVGGSAHLRLPAGAWRPCRDPPLRCLVGGASGLRRGAVSPPPRCISSIQLCVPSRDLHGVWSGAAGAPAQGGGQLPLAPAARCSVA